MTVSISIQYALRQERDDLLTLGGVRVREDARGGVAGCRHEPDTATQSVSLDRPRERRPRRRTGLRGLQPGVQVALEAQPAARAEAAVGNSSSSSTVSRRSTALGRPNLSRPPRSGLHGRYTRRARRAIASASRSMCSCSEISGGDIGDPAEQRRARARRPRAPRRPAARRAASASDATPTAARKPEAAAHLGHGRMVGERRQRVGQRPLELAGRARIRSSPS